MPKKRTLSSVNAERVGLRLSSHEKVCAERMKTLFKAIDELKIEVKSLRNDVSRGKGMISVIVFLGALVASVLGYLKLDG